MKNKAFLTFLLLLVLTAVTWVGLFKNQTKAAVSYSGYLSTADKCMAKGIYIDAIKNYKSALETDHKYETAMKLVSAYQKLGDYEGMITACDEAIEISPKSIEPYSDKIDYYISKAEYQDALKVMETAKDVSDQNKLKEIKANLHTKFDMKYLDYTDVKDWHTQKDLDYIAVCLNDKWGMASSDGTMKINAQFDSLGAYSDQEEVIPCSLNGENYYIDKDGNRKLVGDKSYTYLGSFGSGYAPAQFDGKYGYIDKDFKEYHFEYDYAGAFANGIAAVQKNGKWALINDKFKSVTDFIYDDIKLDSYGFCSVYGAETAEKDGLYYLIDTSGKNIIKTGYSNMSMAASKDGAVAVEKDGKWGFVSRDDKMIIDPQYDDAVSFSLGFAPVKKGDNWAYIDENNQAICDFQYSDAKPFSENGSAAVGSYGYWSFIVLCEYEK